MFRIPKDIVDGTPNDLLAFEEIQNKDVAILLKKEQI